MSWFLLSVYFTRLFCFSLVSKPISYCLLLLLGAISSSFFVYCFMGFSWYLVLFCLVYVGGVYVLFIYASIFSPNNPIRLGGGAPAALISFLVFSIFL